MSRYLAFVPVSAGTDESRDLIYSERSSRARGLHVLMQDASARAGQARHSFLLACLRDTVAQYLATEPVVGAVTFLRDRVKSFNAMACGVDTRVDDFEELGLFIVLREPECLYILCARSAPARVRSRGSFVPLATPDLEGVEELAIETSRAQHDLFAQALPETLALYRVTNGSEPRPREVLLGGSMEDMALAAEATDQLHGREAERHTVDRLQHTVMLVTVDGATATDAVPAHTTHAERAARAGGMRWVTGAMAAFVVVATAVSGSRYWNARVQEDAQVSEQTALKETPTPPPPQKRVMEDVVVEQEKAAAPDKRGFEVAWQQSLRDAVTSSPALAGDAVIFGARDGKVYSVERASGKRQWAYAARAGVGASPVVRGANVVAADYAGNVVRLRAGNGSLQWKRALGDKVVSTPAVSAERVVVGTMNGRVYALSYDSGRMLWKFSARGAVRGAIAYAGESFLVPSSDGHLYALAEDTGKRLWELSLGGPVVSSPASDGDLVVIGSPRGDVVAVDLGKGTQRWKYHAGGAVNSGLVIDDGRVYAGAGDRRIYCIDARKGDLVWRFDTDGVILSRPFVGDGRVLVTSYDGSVYCLNADDGALIDRYDTGKAIFSSPLVVDGRVFFGNNAGRFFCLDSPES